MASILDDLAAQIGPDTIRQMSARIGAQPGQTASAVEAAIPLLLGQLQRNASTPSGASALAGALDRNHDGSILDDLAGFLTKGPSASDARSLDHIFGTRKGTVESAVERRSGLDGGQVMQLLAMLAPMILGMLAKQRGAAPGGGGLGRAGAGGGGGLADILGGALGQMQQRSPGLGGMLGGLLDEDGDGSMIDDLLEKGLGGGAKGSGGGDVLGGVLGGLLGGRR
jgi:hypothetical protein